MVRRNKGLHVCLSEKEFEKIKEIAEKNFMPISTLIRYKFLTEENS